MQKNAKSLCTMLNTFLAPYAALGIFYSQIHRLRHTEHNMVLYGPVWSVWSRIVSYGPVLPRRALYGSFGPI